MSVFPRRRLAAACGAALALAPALSADAQSLATLRERFLIPDPPPAEEQAIAYRAAPAISANTPTGFGAALGDVWAGVGLQTRTRFTVQPDGLAGAGIGLGSASRAVGVDVDLVSFSTARHGLGTRSAVDLKLHRLLGERTAIAVGVESAFARDVDHPASWYGVVSRFIPFRESPNARFGAITASFGVGDGRFRTENQWLDSVSTFNVFGSIAAHVIEPVTIITEWTGQDLAVNVSVVPLRRLPIVVTAGVVDATGLTGDGPRFVAAVGAGLSLRGRRW